MSSTNKTTACLEELRAKGGGRVVGPGEPEWDAARSGFNLAVDQRPAAVTFPRDEHEVGTVVAIARRHGLRVAPQTTGHNAGPLGDLADTVLLKTAEMTGVEIDAGARRARVRAGTRWEDVTSALSEHGLVALHGSSPDVGVVGYSLGGGMGWYGRKHGLQCNSVTAIELVTADGRVVRTDRDNEPELFWALRGGGGNFGVVTAIEFDLFGIEEVYAGWLIFPWERSAEVLHAWNRLLPSLPEDMSSIGRILQLPPIPEIPEPLRGRNLVVVEAAYLGSAAEGERLLAPLRDLGPEMDTFATMPPAGLGELHQDPRDPLPGMSASQLLGELPAEAIDELVSVAGPGSGSNLISVELRHTGGALARSATGHGARATLPGTLAMMGVGSPFDPDAATALAARLGLLTGALKRWEAGHYLNFVEERFDTALTFSDEDWRRLRAVKAEVDPDGVFRANHPIASVD